MKKMKQTKRILAWIGIVLLAAMYVVTFVLALFDSPLAQMMFRGSFYMTVMIPFLLYAFILVHKILNRNNQTSDLNDEEDRKE